MALTCDINNCELTTWLLIVPVGVYDDDAGNNCDGPGFSQYRSLHQSPRYRRHYILHHTPGTVAVRQIADKLKLHHNGGTVRLKYIECNASLQYNGGGVTMQ